MNIDLKIDKLSKSKIWKYIYITLISYIFFSSIIKLLSWSNTNNLFCYTVIYHDEIIILLSSLLFVKSLLFEVVKSIKCKKYSIGLIKYFLPYILIVLVYFGTRNKLYFSYATIILNASELTFNNNCKVYLYSKLVGIIVWIISYSCGLLNVVTNTRSGNTLGMSFYNDAAFTIIYVLLVWWYLYGNRNKIISIILNFCTFLLITFVIKSRTGIVMSATLFIIYFIDTNKIKRSNAKDMLFKLFPLLMLLLATAIGFIYTYLFSNYNVVPLLGFSSRFAEIAIELKSEGISLFPNTTPDWFTMYFDNTYANFMFKRGLICTLIFLYVAYINNKKILFDNNKLMIIFSLFVYVYAQMEYVVKGEILILLLFYYFSKRNTGDLNE